MIALTLAFLIGALAFGPAWVLLGALVADTLTVRRYRRRRTLIDLHGADAVEAWLAEPLTWSLPSNGTPFLEDEAA